MPSDKKSNACRLSEGIRPRFGSVIYLVEPFARRPQTLHRVDHAIDKKRMTRFGFSAGAQHSCCKIAVHGHKRCVHRNCPAIHMSWRQRQLVTQDLFGSTFRGGPIADVRLELHDAPYHAVSGLWDRVMAVERSEHFGLLECAITNIISRDRAESVIYSSSSHPLTGSSSELNGRVRSGRR